MKRPVGGHLARRSVRTGLFRGTPVPPNASQLFGADHREAEGIGYNLLRVGRQNIRTMNNCYDWELINILKTFPIQTISTIFLLHR